MKRRSLERRLILWFSAALLLMAALLFISAIIRGIFCSKNFYYKNRISPEELHEKVS